MRESIRDQLIIIAVASFVFFTNLGVPRLWDEDEPKNAACASEMYQRGDWIVPTFNGELRTDKPILLYWFMLVAYHVLGINELGARFWSAVFGIGTALLTYNIGCRLFNRAVALWAGVLLCGGLLFVVASRAATPDSLLIFFSTLGLWAFVRGTFGDSAATVPGISGLPARRTTYVMMYAAMGVAVLAKGPVGLVLPTAVIGCYLLCRNGVAVPAYATGTKLQRGLVTVVAWLVRTFWPRRVIQFAWKLRPVTACIVAGAIVLPWYIAVGVKTDGEWLSGFLFKHNIGRFLEPMEGHGGPPFYHFMSLAVGFFPLSVLLIPTIVHAARRLRGESQYSAGYLFALCWVAVYVGFFSFAGTKLPSYVTPTHPALALLTACLLHEWVRSPAAISRFWMRTATGIWAVVGVAIIVGCIFVLPRVLPGERGLAALGCLLLFGAACFFYLTQSGRRRSAALTLAAVAVLFSTSIFGWAAVRVDRLQNAAPLVAAIQREAAMQPQIAGYRAYRPSWTFYAQQPIPLFRDAGEASAFLAAADDNFIITVESKWDELKTVVSSEVEVLERRKRFLKQDSFLVVGRRAAMHADGPIPPRERTASDNRPGRTR